MTRFQVTRRLLPIFGVATVLLAGSAAAQSGDGPASGSYRLRATVPVACWVEPAGTVLASAGQSGSVVEACNSPGGFTVSASYRPLETAETARLLYGGQMIDLSSSGQQLLRRSNMATIRTVDYRFDEVQLSAPLVLTLTIQPI